MSLITKKKLQIADAVIRIATTTPYSVEQITEMLYKLCDLASAQSLDLEAIIKPTDDLKAEGARELSAALWNYLMIPEEHFEERLVSWDSLEVLSLKFGNEYTIRKMFPRPESK